MLQEQIAGVRRFNRSITNHVGALDESFLGLGRPLGEARLIFEIGTDGAEVRSLRQRLNLDSGYLSRLLRSLDRQGLIVRSANREDGRVQDVRLTPAGCAIWGKLDSASSDHAASQLSPLSDRQRERLVGAMAEIERLHDAAAVTFDVEQPDNPAVALCLDAYFQELQFRFEEGFEPSKGLPVRDSELVVPHGVLILARLRDVPIACGALKTNAPGVGYIKRMWVAERMRGLGIGHRLLQTLEQHARSMGFHTVQLETNRALKEAQALYLRSGYREVAPFNDEVHAHHWFEKMLPQSDH